MIKKEKIFVIMFIFILIIGINGRVSAELRGIREGYRLSIGEKQSFYFELESNAPPGVGAGGKKANYYTYVPEMNITEGRECVELNSTTIEEPFQDKDGNKLISYKNYEITGKKAGKVRITYDVVTVTFDRYSSTTGSGSTLVPHDYLVLKPIKKETHTITIYITETTGRENHNFVSVVDDINYYQPDDQLIGNDATYIEHKTSVILTVITNIGMIIAVVMCAVLGVKYMLGSVEEKAEYKKDMIPYLVGAFLLFGITVIVKVLQQLGQTINNL